MEKRYIGVDLHTTNFSAYFLNKKVEEYKIYDLSAEGIADFTSSLSKRDELAIEATSNSAFFSGKISKYVGKIILVAPGEFQVIAKSAKKTDFYDSQKLAFFLSKGMLPHARKKSYEHQLIMSFLILRSQLIRMRTKLINITHSILVSHGIKLTKSHLNRASNYNKKVLSHDLGVFERVELEVIYDQICLLETAVKKIESQISFVAATQYGYQNLLTVKGVGPIIAATLVSVIGDINDFPSSPKLASYFGIVPRVRESNSKIKKCRISKRGSKIGRTALIQASWVAIRYNKPLKDFYERKKKQSCPMKAIVATSRKLLAIIYIILKNNWSFEEFSSMQISILKK